MIHVRFTAEAAAEFLAQIEYYEAIEKGLGARFRVAVEQAAARASTFPMHGKPAAAGTRRRRVVRFPFSLYYTEAANGVLIHAVAGDRQLPGYWRDRLASDR